MDQFLWEIYNKIFTIIISLQNAIDCKDSLVVHILNKYTYEMLIVFYYVVSEEDKANSRAETFLSFNQYKSSARSWMGSKSFHQLLEEINDNDWLNMHKSLYRNIANLGHPAMNSFLLNRKGEDLEFALTLNTTCGVARNIIEIVYICCNKRLFVDPVDIETTKISLNNINNKLSSLADSIKLFL